MTEELIVNIKSNINAPIKEVFEAWLSKEALKEFMRPAEGMSIASAEADPVEGGAFLVVMQVGDEQLPHKGEYRKIDRYNELHFTWLSNHTSESSLVKLEFSEIDSSNTEVKLTHTGFPNQESRDNHNGGWGRILVTLDKYLG